MLCFFSPDDLVTATTKPGCIDLQVAVGASHGGGSVGLDGHPAAKDSQDVIGEFQHSHGDIVDTRLMLMGLNLHAMWFTAGDGAHEIDTVTANVQQSATAKLRLVAAGGISTRDEVSNLDKLGIDAVVGMAIYTGALELEKFR